MRIGKSYPRIDRQTLPFLYRFGLKRTVLFPVVINRQRGARIGLKYQIKISLFSMLSTY
jgi:hypothetical protein